MMEFFWSDEEALDGGETIPVLASRCNSEKIKASQDVYFKALPFLQYNDGTGSCRNDGSTMGVI